MGNPFFDDVAGPASALSKPGALTWFDGLTEDRQKKLSVFMIARMMAGTNDPVHILRMNRVFNPYHFGDAMAGVLTPRKSDHMKLLAVAAGGRKVPYTWLKGPGSKAKKLAIECTMAYYDCSMREAQTYRIDTDSLIEMAEELGWDKEEITKLKKELDDGSGVTAKASSKPAKPARGKRA